MYGIDVKDTDSADAVFSSIISALYSKFGKIVVLIDEYDYPLLRNAQSDDFEQIRNLFMDFYSVLKTKQDYIRFCFITGITKFPQVSIFSQLNNLVDLNNKMEYVSICGYTDEEIDYYFTPYMEKYFIDNNIASEEEKKSFRDSIK